MATTLQLTVTDNPGLRLDRWLTDHAPDRTRSQIQHDLEAGHITVNGAAEPARYKVHEGDAITYTIPAPDTERLKPESIPLTIVHEDEHVVVINKPAGMVVHPAPGHLGGTLANALLAHCGPELAGVGGEGRWGIVHRLDAQTSGLMVAARTQLAYRALTAALARREISRRYVAIVIGTMHQDSGSIDRPLGRRVSDRKKIGIAKEGQGRPSQTDWRVIVQDHGLALLGLTLHTGRTHQIRVHLESIGRPILSDPDYGWTLPRTLAAVTPKLRPQLSAVWPGRQMLHAARLSFNHPATSEPLLFTAPPPEDMTAVLDLVWPNLWQPAIEKWLKKLKSEG
ncbi:RluA family pseudouridine synthase [bacterium]|nr:RluA family pseudouridine synthase [bacterium]